MSLKSKIEAVIYASEEPVTLAQLAGLLGEEAQAELDAFAAKQSELPLEGDKEGAEDGDSPASTEDETGLPEDIEAFPESAVGQDESFPVEVGPVDAETTDAAGDEQTSAAAEGTEISPDAEKKQQRERERRVREHIRQETDTLIREYAENDRGIEVREVAGGYRMGTKPEYHDAVRGFVKSLKPPLKLTLQALETLAVVAYKQPVTAAEITEIRGVDSAGVLGGLMTRKLIATAGRKQVIGRPMLYKTTKDFLMRFGLKDINELPSIEEFEKMASELSEQEDLPIEHHPGEPSPYNTQDIIERANARGDAEHLREEEEALEEKAAKDEPAADEPSAEE